jgi:cytochrome c2
LFRVQAQTQSDFQQWLQQQAAGGQPQAKPAVPPAAPSPQPNTGAAASPVASPAASRAPGAPAPAAPAAPAPPAAAAGNPQLGAQLIGQKGCGGCHTIPGIQGAAGTIGPNLGGVASRNRIAGGAVPNTGPDDLKKWIMNPQALKPGTAMPNLGLSDSDATNIVAYLETLK